MQFKSPFTLQNPTDLDELALADLKYKNSYEEFSANAPHRVEHPQFEEGQEVQVRQIRGREFKKGVIKKDGRSFANVYMMDSKQNLRVHKNRIKVVPQELMNDEGVAEEVGVPELLEDIKEVTLEENDANEDVDEIMDQEIEEVIPEATTTRSGRVSRAPGEWWITS